MIPRLIRKTGKWATIAAGAIGLRQFNMMRVNDDLDDCQYFFLRHVYDFARPSTGTKKKVVVLGSSWAALSFIAKADRAEYDITVVSPKPYFFDTSLLLDTMTLTLPDGAATQPINNFTDGCSFVCATAHDVDLQKQQVHIHDATSRVALEYDHLIVAVGSEPDTLSIPGIANHAHFIQDPVQGKQFRKDLLRRVEEAELANLNGDFERVKQLLHFVVAGACSDGAQLCSILSDFIARDLSKWYPELKPYFRISLLEPSPDVLPKFRRAVGEHVRKFLLEKNVEIRCNASVQSLEPNSVHIHVEDGGDTVHPYGIFVWSPGFGMQAFSKVLCRQAGQGSTSGIAVDGCFRVLGTTPGQVFAIGDCATSKMPVTEQIACQQGKNVGRMFRVRNQHELADPGRPPFGFPAKAAVLEPVGAEGMIDSYGWLKFGDSLFTDQICWRAFTGDCEQISDIPWNGWLSWMSVNSIRLHYFGHSFVALGNYVQVWLQGRSRMPDKSQ